MANFAHITTKKIKKLLALSSPGKILQHKGPQIKLAGLLIVSSLLLSACEVYNGFPTATVVPSHTVAPAATIKLDYPTPTPEPPFPSATPRPTLPPVPASITSTKIDIVKKAFTSIFDNFYHTVSSADLYEVGLRGLVDTLKQAGVQNPQVPIPGFTGDRAHDESIFNNAFLLTLDRYKSQISEDKLAYGAIDTAVNSLQECHTAFYPPDKATDYVLKRRGLDSKNGLGILTLKGSNGLAVSHVLPQSPADKSGLKAGDTILEVDGQSLAGKDITEAITLLRGGANPTAGSQVSLKVQHPGSNNSVDLKIIRGEVDTLNIESQIINGDTGYIRFNSFPLQSQATLTTQAQQLDKILADFDSKNVKGIVLDVRGNTNGSIRTVQEYISRFISGDQLVYFRTQDNSTNSSSTATPAANADPNVIKPMPSSGNIKPTTKPLAVLIDATTSGEAEIFAYILQSQKTAKLYGADTAGCTTASSPFGLADNSILNIAIYRPITDPNDPSSTLDVVKPDEEVPFDVKTLQQGHDNQLDRAVQVLEGK